MNSKDPAQAALGSTCTAAGLPHGKTAARYCTHLDSYKGSNNQNTNLVSTR